jgi:hypothetical protein
MNYSNGGRHAWARGDKDPMLPLGVAGKKM